MWLSGVYLVCCMVMLPLRSMQVACGSGLERIYEFMQTDEHCIRPHLDMTQKKVSKQAGAVGQLDLAGSLTHVLAACAQL